MTVKADGTTLFLGNADPLTTNSTMIYQSNGANRAFGFNTMSDGSYLYRLQVLYTNLTCFELSHNPPYGQMTERGCFSEDPEPFGNFLIGKNATDF